MKNLYVVFLSFLAFVENEESTKSVLLRYFAMLKYDKNGKYMTMRGWNLWLVFEILRAKALKYDKKALSMAK